MDSLQILPLWMVPKHLDAIASWIWNEWRDTSDGSLSQTRRRLDRKPPPNSLVALLGGSVCGALLFRRVRYMGREPLQLFLDALYVVENARHQGIASRLLEEGIREAARSDSELRVYTQIPDWYEARGFHHVEHDPDNEAAVLRCTLPHAAAQEAAFPDERQA